MAATTPRKRAPAKKTAPKPASVTHMDAFRGFRAKAKGRYEHTISAQSEDYILDESRGFDPPIVGSWPTDDLEKEILLIDSVRAIDSGTDKFAALDVLRLFFGYNDFNRIVRTFNAFDDKHELLFGLCYDVMDFYTGKGGGDTPGGTQAS